MQRTETVRQRLAFRPSQATTNDNMFEMSPLQLNLSLTIRSARDSDLDALEWFGQFWAQRELLRSAWRAAQTGQGDMLVASAQHDFPVAQLCVRWPGPASNAAAELWALRVIHGLHGLGIGRSLIAAAEARARSLGFAYAEISAETSSPPLRAFYEHLGYVLQREALVPIQYTRPDGMRVTQESQQWILRKSLRSVISQAAGHAFLESSAHDGS